MSTARGMARGNRGLRRRRGQAAWRGGGRVARHVSAVSSVRGRWSAPMSEAAACYCHSSITLAAPPCCSPTASPAVAPAPLLNARLCAQPISAPATRWQLPKPAPDRQRCLHRRQLPPPLPPLFFTSTPVGGDAWLGRRYLMTRCAHAR